MLETDLLVIGGGINGVGVAADAACRGLKVILCEKGDLANASSSASTKLVHGGLRYLEQAQFRLVRESLKERAILLKRAPHLVHPLKFIFPYTAQSRPSWQIALGLKIYDWLSLNSNLESSKHFLLDKKLSPLKSFYHEAFSYSDAQTDDARLVILNALLAQNKGAKILSHTECIQATALNGAWILSLKTGDREQKIKAQVVVNASGSSVKQVLEKVFSIESQTQIRLIKGSHIVIPKLYQAHEAYTLQNADGRIIFTLPYESNYTLIGTTDISFNTKDIKPEVSADEISYLVKSVNHYFTKEISADDLVWSYSGLRCLVYSGEENPSLMSREHKIEVNLSKGAVLINLYGGKLTSYRSLAAKAVNSLRIYFSKLNDNSTQGIILPGGNLNTNFANFTQKLLQQYSWLPPELIQRYARCYGKLSQQILSNAHSFKDLGLDFGAGLYQAEVDYLVKHEWATSSEDLLWRRTKLGLRSKEIELKNLGGYLEGIKHERT